MRKRCRFARTSVRNYGIMCADNSRIVAFDASVGTSETWKVHVCAKRSGECTRKGACLSRGSHWAFPGPQTKHGMKSAPSFFARDRKEGTGRTSDTNRHSRKKKGDPWGGSRVRATAPDWDSRHPGGVPGRASRSLLVNPLARTWSRNAKGYAEF
jgi:hypothetical protein